jgi:hypothetical protein
VQSQNCQNIVSVNTNLHPKHFYLWMDHTNPCKIIKDEVSFYLKSLLKKCEQKSYHSEQPFLICNPTESNIEMDLLRWCGLKDCQ